LERGLRGEVNTELAQRKTLLILQPYLSATEATHGEGDQGGV
jgi:hypothetical protein